MPTDDQGVIRLSQNVSGISPPRKIETAALGKQERRRNRSAEEQIGGEDNAGASVEATSVPTDPRFATWLNAGDQLERAERACYGGTWR